MSRQRSQRSEGRKRKHKPGVRILLIASDERDRTLINKHKKIGVFLAPPFGLYRMKTYLETKGLANVDIFDPNLYPEGMEEDLTKTIDSKLYDIIGFSVTHINLKSDMRNIANIKSQVNLSARYEKKPILVAGGQEVTGNYEQWLRNSPLDLVVIGYGEGVLENIIGVFESKPEGSLDRFSKVPGLVYYKNGEPRAQLAERISNDRFREIAFTYDPTNGIPYEGYWRQNSLIFSAEDLRARRATLKCVRLFTSSHCNNACGFCSSSSFLRHATGIYTPVYRLTADEIVELVRRNFEVHNPDAVFFNDDDFVIGDKSGIKRVMEFSRLIKEAKKKCIIPEGLKFYLQTKATSLTKRTTDGRYVPNQELMDAMKEAGVVLVGVGVETFSDYLLKSPSINKKMLSVMADAAIDGLFEAGITPLINLILLPPETTKEDILITADKTIEYVRRGAKVIMQPLIEVFPGAPIAEPEVLAELPHQDLDVEVASGTSTVKVVTYILPQDEEIKEWAEHIEDEGDKVIAEFPDNPDSGFEYPPQHIRALTYFIPILNRMGSTDRVDKIYNVIWNLAKVYKSNFGCNADLYSSKLAAIRSLSVKDINRVKRVLKTIGHEGSCRDIEYLIMMYEGRFFYDDGLSEWAGTQSDTILIAISRIIFRHTQFESFQFDPQLVEFLKRFSKLLVRDYRSQEAERLLALLNFEFDIKTDVLGNFMLDDGTLVNIVPDIRTIDDKDSIINEFRGKSVLVCEEHHDDAVFSVGNLIQDKISPFAQRLALVTTISDPLGVTDAYAADIMRQKHISSDKANVNAVKKSIRENEGKHAARAMCVDRYITMKAEYRTLDPVYDSEGKLKSYYTRWRPFRAETQRRAVRLIKEEEPDCIIMGLPRIAYHQGHRDAARLFLNSIVEVNRSRVLEGKEPIKIYFYAVSTDKSLFDTYDIRPNIINPVDERGHERKQAVIKCYASQLARVLDYGKKTKARDGLHVSYLNEATRAEHPYAEPLLSAKLLRLNGTNLYSEVKASSAECSVDIILDKLREVSTESEKQLRLYVLDGNICYETRNNFGFIPQPASGEVCELLTRLKTVSLVADVEGVNNIENMRGYVRSLIEAVNAGDVATLLNLVNETSHCPVKLEVFSEEDVSNLPQGTKALTWQSVIARRLKNNNIVSVGTHQLHYYYYLGIFQKMSESDIFVLVDNLQYARKEWQNRQRFGEGGEWLTVPLHRGHITDKIGDKSISNASDWRRRHMAQLRRMLSGHPFYIEHVGFLEELYRRKWNTLSALCETTTRYVAKSIGIKGVSLIRASFAGEIPPEYKKGRYIAETVRRVAASFLNKTSFQIVHISGQGAHYLDEPDEEGILNKDMLLSQGVQIDFPAYNPNFTRQRWGIDPFSSGLEVLCRLGPKAVDILKYFAQQVNK